MNQIIQNTKFSSVTKPAVVSPVIFGMCGAANGSDQNDQAKFNAANTRIFKLGSLKQPIITAKLSAAEKYEIAIARRRFTPEQLQSSLRAKINDKVIITDDLREKYAGGRVTMQLGEKNKGETIYMKTLPVETPSGKINYFVWDIDFESSAEKLKPHAGQSTKCTLDICGQIINKFFQAGKSKK